MDVLAGVARARLREGEDDGHEVVPRLPFELLDPLHGHELRRRLLRDLRRGLPRDEADLGLRAGEGRFNVQGPLETRLLLADPFHLWSAVSKVDGTKERHAPRRRQGARLLRSFWRCPRRGGLRSLGRRVVRWIRQRDREGGPASRIGVYLI